MVVTGFFAQWVQMGINKVKIVKMGASSRIGSEGTLTVIYQDSSVNKHIDIS